MKKMTFSKKVAIGLVLIAVIGILPLLGLSYLSLQSAEKALEHSAEEHLVAVRELKEKMIMDYMEQLEADIHLLSQVVETFHGNYEPNFGFLEAYKKEHGYYDLFLIRPDGYVFYTVAKEADYQSNLINGKYASTNLGKLVREVLQKGDSAMADFESYAPSNGDAAAFIAHPVMVNGKLDVILALQVPMEDIDKIMQVRDGMGETGETYLIGPDLLMRSDSYLDPKNHSVLASFKNPELGKVDTEGAKAALRGEIGEKHITAYNGNLVVSAYTPLKVNGLNWALLAEIDMAEVDIPVVALEKQVYLITGLALVVVLAVIALIAWVARGEVNFLSLVVRELNSASDQVASASEQISSGAQQLSQGATEQAASLEEVSASMEEVASQAENNSSGAANTAQAVVEMAEMVAQSATNAQSAAGLSKQAEAAAKKGGEAMSLISRSMSEILVTSNKVADIIEVINEITHQTKMLATNAAIEAARAGEQGKGFAVVADEVSKLAESSKSSAKEIGSLIKESNQKAKQGEAYVKEGEEVLKGILDQASQVAGLVVQISGLSQKSAEKTSEVNGLVNGIQTSSKEQAMGVTQVAQAITELDQVTQSNAANAEESASAAEELNAQAESLKVLVAQMASHFGVNRTAEAAQFEPVAHNKKAAPAARISKEVQTSPAPVRKPALLTHGTKPNRVVKPAHEIPMRDDFDGF
ncbi:MAG: hypothetical protein A2557_02650 [Candidatus Lambdaproteobacteria bacterium RIFOXYD2_FULL_56_26]|uniref:Methyl-accepting transducer domain-containing protein n=1 Tax=Candidatus Lambdaproteobacteria bacterium RIFOXYD2_FULL_56_26 TaxID=1817773 RepID=A0A1F6GZA0_9PROT|nr:MAG: hypothetical protein A2426_10035 [Candidatus Lambdaproteobacteria bacterium RIFOXYC1_FULL_56_13]OGH03402.1 MAG: hypothetical protein A2557_02650 [Candidatus Lambdaproteobacteria bacterium RIFOXYD2_FULL_56_26]